MKEGINLIHISPELPPTIGGIADYTTILSRRLVEVSDEAVKPILVRAGWKEDEPIETELPAKDLSGQCSAEALASTITNLAEQTQGKAIVLLEYSGYGYARRGAPLWLLRGLKRICGKKDIPLVTMFHELYATGKPWSSVFWMSPMQRYVAARLARLSDAVVTNREQSATWLRKYINDEKPLQVQPVFSNVGEPESVLPFEERESYAVVFGGCKMKQRLYDGWNTTIDNFLQEAGIKKIIDIGSSDPSFYRDIGWPVEVVGIQPASAISDYLRKARVGLLHLPVNCLTKSGIFGAYAAHGLAVGVKSDIGDPAPLRERKHFYRFMDGSNNHLSFNSMGRNLFEWYIQEVSILQTTKKLMDSFISQKHLSSGSIKK